MGARTFDVARGLIPLPGSPQTWIWAFTCPEPECGCRIAILLSVSGGRDQLAEIGRPVADAWRGGGQYGEAAQSVRGATAFAIDLDTREVYPPVGEAPLDVGARPEVGARYSG